MLQIDNAIIDRITRNLLGVFEMAGATHAEFVRKLRDGVQEAVEHFDLVTREEFDATQKLLSNTRIKADALEKRVIELEAALSRMGTDVGDEEKT